MLRSHRVEQEMHSAKHQKMFAQLQTDIIALQRREDISLEHHNGLAHCFGLLTTGLLTSHGKSFKRYVKYISKLVRHIEEEMKLKISSDVANES